MILIYLVLLVWIAIIGILWVIVAMPLIGIWCLVAFIAGWCINGRNKRKRKTH